MSWVHLNTDHFLMLHLLLIINNALKVLSIMSWWYLWFPPLYFKMTYSYSPQIWSSLRCSLIVGITDEKEPLFHQDTMTDLKSYQDDLSQLIFTFQFHNQFNLFNKNFESYYIPYLALDNKDLQTNKKNLKFETEDVLLNHYKSLQYSLFNICQSKFRSP